jgi:hypothetical protein
VLIFLDPPPTLTSSIDTIPGGFGNSGNEISGTSILGMGGSAGACRAGAGGNLISTSGGVIFFSGV